MIPAAPTPSRRRRAWLAALPALLGLLLVSGCASDPSNKKGPIDLPQLLEQARDRLDRKKFYQARSLLEMVLNHPSADSAMLAEAQLLLADAYFFDTSFLNLTEAQGRYQSFISFHPRHERIDYAQYQLGMCYFLQVLKPDRDQDQTRRAIEEFRKIESLYPGSRYLPLARDRIGECFLRVAEHEFVVGKFYLDRKAPRAALERFLVLLREFPEYSRREKLYFFIAKAYRKAGDPRGEREYLQRLLAEYPDGPYAEEARQALKKKEGADPALSRTAPEGPPGVDS